MASEERTGRIRAAAFDLGIEGYEVAGVVGRGGHAVVYRAIQPSFNRTVAVKVLSHANLDAAALRRFDRERSAIGTLSGHPNIVTVYDSGLTAADVPYLAMEYLGRGSLADHLDRDGTQRWEDVLPLGIKLAGALETAHRMGVLHCDIKPENVLVSNFGEPKLADFGIAHVVGLDTRSATLELSVLHAPPEIVDGKPATASSDIYSLGSTLFTLLWGRPPFLDEADESLVPLLFRIGTAPLPDLTTLGVPEPVQRVFEKVMAKDPSRRYPSALAMARALQQVQAKGGLLPTEVPLEDDTGDPTAESAAPSPPTRPRSPTLPAVERAGAPQAEPRHIGRLALLSALLAIAVVLAAAAVLVTRSNKDQAAPGTTRTSSGAPRPTTAVNSTFYPLPTQPTALAAGHYHSVGFQPELRFQLDEGWNTVGEQRRTATGRTVAIELARPDIPDGGLGFYIVDEAIDPSAAPANETEVSPAARKLPTDGRSVLLSNPRLSIDSATTLPATSGRPDASVAEFSVASGYHYRFRQGDTPCASLDCVLLFRNSKVTNPGNSQMANPMLLVASTGERDRFLFIRTGSDVVLIVISAPANSFDRFARMAQPVVDAMIVQQ